MLELGIKIHFSAKLGKRFEPVRRSNFSAGRERSRMCHAVTGVCTHPFPATSFLSFYPSSSLSILLRISIPHSPLSMCLAPASAVVFSGEPPPTRHPLPLFTSFRRGFSPFIFRARRASHSCSPTPPSDGPRVGGGRRRKYAVELHLVDGMSCNRPRWELQPVEGGAATGR